MKQIHEPLGTGNFSIREKAAKQKEFNGYQKTTLESIKKLPDMIHQEKMEQLSDSFNKLYDTLNGLMKSLGQEHVAPGME